MTESLEQNPEKEEKLGKAGKPEKMRNPKKKRI